MTPTWLTPPFSLCTPSSPPDCGNPQSSRDPAFELAQARSLESVGTPVGLRTSLQSIAQWLPDFPFDFQRAFYRGPVTPIPTIRFKSQWFGGSIARISSSSFYTSEVLNEGSLLSFGFISSSNAGSRSSSM